MRTKKILKIEQVVIAEDSCSGRDALVKGCLAKEYGLTLISIFSSDSIETSVKRGIRLYPATSRK